MNLKEFSYQFDTLCSSYRRFKNFDDRELLDSVEFDEYEKSFYLTKAQEELIISLYNGKNTSATSFEETEEWRRYLSNLIEEVTLKPIVTSNGAPLGMGSKSKFFTLPEDVWFITYESANVSDVRCEDNSSVEVVPVRQDEYHRIKNNPFRGVNDRRALRLDLSDNVAEIISKFNITDYYVRYLRKVQPIVLEDMPDDLTINGVKKATECEVHESLHHKILELAVDNALRTKIVGSKPAEQNK